MNYNSAEAELIERIKKDASAFSILFHQYYKEIFGYVFRRTGNFDDALDISAETFHKVYAGIKHFEYKGISIKVWIYRIATNETNQYFRTKKKAKSFFVQMPPEEIICLQQIATEDKAILEAEWKHLQQFKEVMEQLQTLPISCQEVISLRYFEGKSLKEICEILQMKEGTLKSLLFRSIKKLKEKCNLF